MGRITIGRGSEIKATDFLDLPHENDENLDTLQSLSFQEICCG